MVKRVLSCVLTTSMVAALLAGCGGTGNTAGTEEGGVEEQDRKSVV